MDRSIEKMISFFPSLARLLTCLLLFLMPLVFFKSWMFPFISSKLPLFYILSALAFCFLAGNLIFRPENRPSPRQLLPLLPPALLVSWLGLSSWFAPLSETAFWSTLDRGDGWFFFLHLLLLIITVFLLVLKDSSGRYKRNILISILSSSWIVAITVWLGNEGFNTGGKILTQAQGGGLLDNSSLAATYLLFAVFLGLSVVFSREVFGKSMRRFTLLGVIITLASPLFVNFDLWRFAIPLKSIAAAPQILLGSGRGAAIGVVLGIILALSLKLAYAQKKALKIAGFCIVLAGLLGYLSFFVSIQKPESAFQATFKEQAGGNRLVFWAIARQAIAERPVLGWGPENFRVPFHRNFDPVLVRSEESSEPWTDRSHNIFYDMAVAGGYPGLVFFLFALGALAGGTYYAGKRGLVSAWSAAFLLGGLGAYLFQGLFVFDTIFSYLMLGFLYAFIFGLALVGPKAHNLSRKHSQELSSRRVYRIGGASMLLIGFAASALFVAYPLYHAASLFGKVVATPLLERTSLWSQIADNPRLIRQGADLAQLALYAETEFGKKRREILSPGNEAIQADISEDFQIIAGVLDKSVESQKKRNHGAVIYMTLNLAARIHNSSVFLSGQNEEKQLARAEYYGRETIKESPMNPQGYWILAQTLILQKKIKEADEILENAINVDPYNKQSHLFSIQLANGLNDKKLVVFRAERAKQYIPGFTLP